VSDIGRAMDPVLALDEGRRKELKNALVVHAENDTRERFLAEWEDLINPELQ
jgi:hypothetical protein